MRSDRVVEYTIASLVAGFVLEALTPGKVSTVSYVKNIKGLNVYAFLASAPVIYELLKSVVYDPDPKVRIGYWIREGVRKLISNPAIGTNTCLGYMILTIPLAYALRGCAGSVTPYELAERATRIVLSNVDEGIADFYEALRTLSPSYANRYVGGVPDIYSTGIWDEYALRDVLIESSYWDLVAYDVTHHYELTISTHNYMMQQLIHSDMDLLRSIRATQVYMLSRLLDSEVVRSGMVGTAIAIRDYCSLALKLERSLPEDLKELISGLDSDLRSRDINTGTTADIIALAASFTLMSMPGYSSV